MKNPDWKNATPEQLLLWQHAETLIAWNTPEPLFYQGVIAGSEFLIYDAAKLYICLDFDCGNTNNASNSTTRIEFYNQANVLSHVCKNLSLVYEPVIPGIWHDGNNYNLKNICFARMVAWTYTHMRFVGYRLTIV